MPRVRIFAVVLLTCAGLVCLLAAFVALLLPMQSVNGPCGNVWVPVQPAPGGCGELLGSLADVALLLIPSSIVLLMFAAGWSARLLERFLPWPPD